MKHSHVKFIEKDREKLKAILLAKHLHQHEKEFQQKAILNDQVLRNDKKINFNLKKLLYFKISFYNFNPLL